jgi:molecular chaperone DnaK
MAKIVGIDLGTTYSAVSIWDERQQMPAIIPNLRGNNTTPSVVGVNEAGEFIVGEDAELNLLMAPEDTVSEIKREMGTDFRVTMKGQEYNPQTISAIILRYLKTCAERYLGELVYDAVISVPAYFTEVQKTATRDAGLIAGLNVLRLINEPTAAAIAYGVSRIREGEEKVYAVYDLGGGTFDVSIIEISSEDVTVVGTGGDMRLGGLDMDEAIMRWALGEIEKEYGVDLSADEPARQRLKCEAEDIKKALVIAEKATLNVPYLTMVDGKPLNISLQVSRKQFDTLITPLIERSLRCLEAAVASAEGHSCLGWEDLNGVLLVGGPTRIHKIHEMLRDMLQQRRPSEEIEIRADLNPDEVVAMGAAIVAAGLTPFGRPPTELRGLGLDEIEEIQKKTQGLVEVPKVDIFDVTGHSLGIAVEGHKFHKIIEKETILPVAVAHGPFSNLVDYTTKLLVQVYEGEEKFVAQNTKIGEVRIEGLDPLPRGQQMLEVKFTLDISGTLSTLCTDLRTGRVYEGTFSFDGMRRMSDAEIEAKQVIVMGIQMAGVSENSLGPRTRERSPKVRILFLAANPTDTTRLRLDEESRAIDQALRQAEFRDRFDLRSHFAVRVGDIQQLLLRHKPDIVHFCGHGGRTSEISLEDSSGRSHPVSVRALSTLFSVLKDNIKCVVLNACYSERQAQAIAQHIDCVIGMSETIGDKAATSFAAAFYQALGFGRDAKTAFDLGCVQVELENLGEQDRPKLISGRGDPGKITFL